jgi:hypothetical protein
MAVSSALASGDARRFTGLAEQCMAEYDLDGRTIPGFIDPDDSSLLGRCQPRGFAGREPPDSATRQRRG